MRYALVGYGRMGREIERVATERGHTCVAVVDPEAGATPAAADLDAARPRGAQVALEFTTPDAAEGNVVALLRAGIPVVCGTTGWNAAGARVRSALRGSRAGLIVAPNYSVGMHLFVRLTTEAGRAFGAAGLHDPYVVESHHRGKVDAPSGTALRLAAALLDADGRLRRIVEGNPKGRLADGALHVASVRAGHEPGTHTVGFDGEHDVVTLTHRARGRGGFALGAVLAAEWIRGRRGRHEFDEVVADLLARGRGARGSKRGGRR